MKKIQLNCECQYCKKEFETDIMKVLFFRKVTCTNCENFHAVVEGSNKYGTLPGYLAAFFGIIATIGMPERNFLFFAIFTLTTLVSYFVIRYFLYATKKFKVYLTKWYK